MTHGIAYTDGGTRGNPGPYGCAVVLYVDGVGHQQARYLGNNGTVNQAEYEGLLLALQMAKELGVTHLKVRSDSKLIVEQVLGAWRIKEPTLRPYAERACALAEFFEEIQIKHVPREDNVVADALVTALLDARTGRHRGERRAASYVA